jgi:hypothetical protein
VASPKKEITVTSTISHIETQRFPTDSSDTDGVLDTLRDTLDTVAELDADLLHSDTSAGHALVTLAQAARSAAAALGAEPGTGLRAAPGVVVVRDLVAAVSALELAASRRSWPSDLRVLQEIARRVNAAYGRLLLSVPAAT